MTEVSFHFNVANKQRHACLLLRKAYRMGRAIGVVGEADALGALDTALWEVSALDFVPHCLADAPAHVVNATPIVLATDCSAITHSQMLLHLRADITPGFERFERLIEIVGLDAEDRRQARERWRYYADRGYTIRRWDLAARRAARDNG